MKAILADPRAIILHGNALHLATALAPNSVDAIVCDPPYGLGFMGKEWDHDVPSVDFWRVFLEVAKPGAHLLAFGGTRKYHRMTCAIEDAGWEIRDVLSWLYGSGFPKSLNVSKAIDDSLGAERPVVGKIAAPNRNNAHVTMGDGWQDAPDLTAAGSPEAAAWEGWGTALKPAWEPIILARKPLAGTVAANVLAYGTGGLNIDATRIGTDDTRSPTGNRHDGTENYRMRAGVVAGSESGRWPANLVLDEEAAAMLDAQSGISKPKVARTGRKGGCQGAVEYTGGNPDHVGHWPGDNGGGASRFFYVAKAARKEKDAGLAHLEPRTAGEATDREDGTAGLASPRAGAGRTGGARNFHPTVKPLSLMRWLCRLITPPGGVVLDPFAGSGSTLVAALEEGFSAVGVELGGEGGEYLPIIEGRVRHALGNTKAGASVEEP